MKLISLIIIAFYCTIGVLRADITYENPPGLFLSMTSFTDEHGLFSYTFSGGTSDTSRFLNPSISIDASLVNSTECPIGWETTLESGLIIWQWTSPEPFLFDDTPFTFTAYCSETESIVNNNGLFWGEIYSEIPPLPGFSNSVGVQIFSYLQPIPEPSSSSLIIICGLGMILYKRHKGRTRRSSLR